ncbi:succinate dehydrogenase assembly factor 2, mitochondrial-like [Babylonia areolata]|uniref:succinate dehydrogenase assembly factor 2, mitochondrial-like n=1 Tax=Babylonia areolata TaxID=304850 RepID=UPI003FD35EA3
MAHVFRIVSRNTKNAITNQIRTGTLRCLYSSEPSDPTLYTADTEPPLPKYQERTGEDIDLMRSRLLYQSRKRGMLENGLLLSTFAGQFLDKLTAPQLKMYDTLINKPSNDWEIYYWMTGVKEAPEEYNNEVLDMLKEHTQNSNMEQRIRQPDLKLDK